MKKLATLLSVAVAVAWLALVAVEAQKNDKPLKSNPYRPTREVTGPTIHYDNPMPELAKQGASKDWAFHNLDLSQSRFAELDQINTSNVRGLTPAWIFQTGLLTAGFHSTPLVVRGVMYVTDGQGSVYAVNAETGDRLWKFDVANLIPGGEFGITNRGVVYGDGVLYVAAGPSIFAIDPQTGEGIESFGPNGQSNVLFEGLKNRYDIEAPIELGYAFTMAPQFYNGVVFAGATLSERMIPGGMFFAVDGKTGEIIWQFNTIPQGPEDTGWEIAGPTWEGGVRNGGGIWETPSVDPESGTVFISGANATPDLDGSARLGNNLFTNSIIALDINTGALKWFFQQVHHDIWDYDSASSTILFDVEVNGQTVKVVAEAQKNGYVHMLNRETGEPLHGFIEKPVSTVTDVPGEVPSPTQPVPLQANGAEMEPFVPLVAVDVQEGLEDNVVPWMTPPLISQTVHSPGILGGANFAPMAYSSQTGLLYVSGIVGPSAYIPQPVGATLLPGDNSIAAAGLLLFANKNPRGTVTAYDPATGQLVWQSRDIAVPQAGVVVTKGDVVFVGDNAGYIRGFDARTGESLWKFQTGAGIASSPSVYEVNGRTFVTVSSGGSGFGVAQGNAVVTFALPATQ